MAEIEYTYRRQGIRTSENEITRIAINYFIEDHLQPSLIRLLYAIFYYTQFLIQRVAAKLKFLA